MSATGQPSEAPEAAAPSAPEAAPAAPAEPAGLDRIYERMDTMASQQAAIAEQFAQLTAPPEEEEDESLFYTDEGELTEDGARKVIADLVQEQVTAQMAPREHARAVEMRDAAYDSMCDEYPELKDGEVSERVLGAAVRWAGQVDPSIIDKPEFVDVIEAFYKADKFETLRSAQEAEQPRPVVLESGSGAARQQRPNEPDWGDRIVKAAERLRPQI
jgi:hypothetical protein